MNINDFDRINVNVNTSQMEQWSILSNVINYVQYNRNPSNYYKLDVKALELKNHRKIYDRLKLEDSHFTQLDFSDTPDTLKGEYLDMYDGARSEVLFTTKFDENSDISTINLGRIDMTRSDKIKGGRKISCIRTRIYSRKIVRWYRMSNTPGHRTR